MCAPFELRRPLLAFRSARQRRTASHRYQPERIPCSSRKTVCLQGRVREPAAHLALSMAVARGKGPWSVGRRGRSSQRLRDACGSSVTVNVLSSACADRNLCAACASGSRGQERSCGGTRALPVPPIANFRLTASHAASQRATVALRWVRANQRAARPLQLRGHNTGTCPPTH